MIAGTVSANHEAIIPFTVVGPTGRKRRVNAVIDTGFDRWLTLPPALIAQLGLPFRRRDRMVLADGSLCVFDLHEATVLWDGRQRRITVHKADATPLVGMALLEGYQLNMQVRVGGKVTLKPLPRRRVRRRP